MPLCSQETWLLRPHAGLVCSMWQSKGVNIITTTNKLVLHVENTNFLPPFFSHSPQPAVSNAVTHGHVPPLPWNTQCLWWSLDTFSCLSINKVYPFSPWGHVSSSLLSNQSSSMCSCCSLQSVLLEIINKYEWLKFKNSNKSVCLCMCPRDWERAGLGCL